MHILTYISIYISTYDNMFVCACLFEIWSWLVSFSQRYTMINVYLYSADMNELAIADELLAQLCKRCLSWAACWKFDWPPHLVTGGCAYVGRLIWSCHYVHNIGGSSKNSITSRLLMNSTYTYHCLYLNKETCPFSRSKIQPHISVTSYVTVVISCDTPRENTNSFKWASPLSVGWK